MTSINDRQLSMFAKVETVDLAVGGVERRVASVATHCDAAVGEDADAADVGVQVAGMIWNVFFLDVNPMSK